MDVHILRKIAMSRLVDVVAKSMELSLVDKIILQKGAGSYSIYAAQNKCYVGELEESMGFCYFSYYMHRMDSSGKLYMCTILALIKGFLSDNFKLIKLEEHVSDHVYYLIMEKIC